MIEKTKEMPIDVTIQGKVIEQQNNLFIYNFYRMANKRRWQQRKDTGLTSQAFEMMHIHVHVG